MNENTKSIGTSTSSITPNSLTSSPKNVFSPTGVDRSKVMSKHVPIGFLPSYTSSEITNSIEPPPYRTDSSCNGQDPPPYPIDELPNEKSLFPYPSELVNPNFGLSYSSSVNPLQEFAGPSAPSILEINHKIGLTPSEREKIVEVLLKMKQTVGQTTELEIIEFFKAQRKLKELLFEAQERLTEEDKNEFIKEAKKIKETQKQNELERREEERKEHLRKEAERRRERQIKEEEEEANDCYCNLWSIFFKALQLGMVIMTYAENKKMKKDDSTSTHLLILLCFVSTIFTSCLLIFYAFGRRPARSMLQAEILYCGFCIFAFCMTSPSQIWRSFNGMIFGLGAAAGYSLDFVHIFYLLKKPSKNDDISSMSELRDIDIQNSPVRGNTQNSESHYTDNNRTDYLQNNFLKIENVVAVVNNSQSANVSNKTLLNLDFLDENYHENDLHQHDHNNSNIHNNVSNSIGISQNGIRSQQSVKHFPVNGNCDNDGGYPISSRYDE